MHDSEFVKPSYSRSVERTYNLTSGCGLTAKERDIAARPKPVSPFGEVILVLHGDVHHLQRHPDVRVALGLVLADSPGGESIAL